MANFADIVDMGYRVDSPTSARNKNARMGIRPDTATVSLYIYVKDII